MIEGESGVLAVSPPWDLGASGGESPPGASIDRAGARSAPNALASAIQYYVSSIKIY